MKTEELIAAMSRDPVKAAAPARVLLWAMLPAVLLAFLLLLRVGGLRAGSR